MTFQLNEDDYQEMNDSWERYMESEEQYEGLNPSEISDLRSELENIKEYERMMLGSWHY